MKCLYLVTGPAGVGKSTISKSIAGNISKCALIEGDDIYHLIVNGCVNPWEDGNHLDVFWKNSIDLINNFLNADISVVFNYIISPDNLKMILNNINKKDVVIKFIVLMIDEDTLIKRDNMREINYRMGERALVLLKRFKKHNYNTKNILDTSNINVEDTVKIIMEDSRFII